MKSSRIVQLAIFAMVVFCDAETEFASPIYSFTTIDVPGASETFAEGINNSGQIVGSFNVFSTLMTHGFLDINGSFITIDFPGVTGATNAYGINNTGQIVGAFSGTGGLAQGFLDTGGSFSNIDVPGATATIPRGINDSGQIVGWYGIAGSLVTHGFLEMGGSFNLLLGFPRLSHGLSPDVCRCCCSGCEMPGGPACHNLLAGARPGGYAPRARVAPASHRKSQPRRGDR